MGEKIYNEAFFAELYDWQHPWPEDYDHFLALADGSKQILDIGCGTGIFSQALAKRGHDVVGVEPAKAMLDVARGKSSAGSIAWKARDATDLSLGREFDMIFMTGNAFQTLLTKDDREKALQNFADHLKPGGKFFFDSRNPFGKAWEAWNFEQTRTEQQHPVHGQITYWVDATYNEKTRIVDYTWTYELDKARHSATSQIAFTPQDELAETIEQAGLRVNKWMKNARGEPFDGKSPDMMVLGSKPD